MKDRVSTQVLTNGAIRYGEYDENGNLVAYHYFKPEDEPTEQGTPLNKSTFLKDTTASFLGLGVNAIPDEVALRCSFTYVVDSDQALSDWANNVTADGQNYTSVLVKSGTWTYNGGINLTTTSTKCIVGESGNLLIVGGDIKYNSLVTDSYINGLNIQSYSTIRDIENVSNIYNCNFEHFYFANCEKIYSCNVQDGRFLGCNYIYGCKVYNSTLSAFNGFSNCKYIYNCVADIQNLSTTYGANAIGFSLCEIVVGCKASGRTNGQYSPLGYGFNECKGVMLCSGISGLTSTTSTFDTSTCCACQKTYSSTYAVANTANGGFNDLT